MFHLAFCDILIPFLHRPHFHRNSAIFTASACHLLLCSVQRTIG